jgi:hypothetical protein
MKPPFYHVTPSLSKIKTRKFVFVPCNPDIDIQAVSAYLWIGFPLLRFVYF